MSKQIIKVSRDEDLYLEWSSIVEAPTFVGDRAQLAAHLMAGHFDEPHSPAKAEERIARADETGTSAIGGWGCGWDDHGEIYMQQGFLLRASMAEFAHRLLVDEDAEPTGLLEPFEDEPDEGRERP